MKKEVVHGDCLTELKKIKNNSIDSIITDPPYGISFMGKKWDYDVPSVDIWKECFRVLKPGGHLLSFAGTRTQHRMAVNIEDAGFEIRDMIAWVYGSGFPKSLNIGKEVERKNKNNTEWEGWGTSLKPALEPITIARKPIDEKNITENVLKHKTGAININECRIPVDPEKDDIKREVKRKERDKTSEWGKNSGFKNEENKFTGVPLEGRFPSNFIHDGSEEVTKLFPNTKNNETTTGPLIDSGNASRFFYCPKASKTEKNKGLENLPIKQSTGGGGGVGDYLSDINSASGKYGSEKAPAKNYHPTVKPLKLIEYLVRLVTPKKGLVLDPFAGSGTTGLACLSEDMDFILIEKEEEYVNIIKERIKNYNPQLKLL